MSPGFMSDLDIDTGIGEQGSHATEILVSKPMPTTITMYSADWCGGCVRAEKFFIKINLDYRKIDLELAENKYFVKSEVLRHNNGKKSIPVIVFADDSHLTEPPNAQLVEKLGLPKRQVSREGRPTAYKRTILRKACA